MKFKNIKAIKTTLLGIVSLASAFVYLFGFDGENTTIIFGLLIFGTLMLFAPDRLINNALRFLKITSKGSTSIEIDDIEINNKESDKEIPNER